MGSMDGWDISSMEGESEPELQSIDASENKAWQPMQERFSADVDDPDLHSKPMDISDVTGIGGSSTAYWDLSDDGSNDDSCDNFTSKSEGVTMGSSRRQARNYTVC